MNAIEWLRDKATTTVDTITLTAADIDAGEAIEPGVYESVTKCFEGNLPAHMIRLLRKVELTKTELVSETIRGHQYDRNWIHYSYTVARRVA